MTDIYIVALMFSMKHILYKDKSFFVNNLNFIMSIKGFEFVYMVLVLLDVIKKIVKYEQFQFLLSPPLMPYLGITHDSQ